MNHLESDRTITIGSKWRHYKKNIYVIQGIGLLEADKTRMVIYNHASRPNPLPWIRSEEEFLSCLKDGTPRFIKIALY